MVCLKSALLERRPDLPLCNLRRLRQLRLGSRHTTDSNRQIRELFSPKSLQKTELDICYLLQSPVKAGHGMSQRDQIAIGKKIVGHLGKDDHWVTTSTAGWTFAAATPEMPEESNRPIDVRQVPKALSLATSGSTGPRELHLLRSRYRTAATEVQAHLATIGGPADAKGRRRLFSMNEGFPKRSQEGILSDEPTHGTCTPAEDKGGRSNRVDDATARGNTRNKSSRRPLALVGQFCQPFKRKVPELDDGFVDKSKGIRARNEAESGHGRGEEEAKLTDSIQQTWSGRSKLKTRTASSPPPRSPKPSPADCTRPRAETYGRPRSRRLKLSIRCSARDDGRTATGRGCCPTEERRKICICSSCVRGERMTPQPLSSRNRFDPCRSEESAGRKATHAKASTPHRGLVITEDLRRELLNPMSQRFELVSGRG